ncbi:MAG: hypothetical protein FWC46_07730 [Actinomycetia bacterium]|nr:hypothetical protein [Actinomycetes bacterium]
MKKGIDSLLVATLVGLIYGLGQPPPAWADATDDTTQGTVTGALAIEPDSVLSPAGAIALQQKLLAQVDLGLLTYADASVAAEEQGTALPGSGGVGVVPASGGLLTGQTAPTSYSLSVNQYRQEKSYYCGPAAAFSILVYHNVLISKDGLGTQLTQGNLASNNYLKTEANGATTWASGAFASGLNKWSGWTGNLSMIQVNAPTDYQLQADAAYRIGYVHSPIAADAVEFTGSKNFYNYHPDNGVNIGHWIVGSAYTSSGASITYVDPAANDTAVLGSSWGQVQPTFTATTAVMLPHFQSNGIVY